MTATATATQARAIIGLFTIVADVVRDSSPIPAATIYASLAVHGCTLAQYERIEGSLIGTGMIRKSGDLLYWNEKAA